MAEASTPARSTQLNVAILATAQVLFQCTQSMSIATTPLAAYAMLGTDKTLATVPVFMSNLGLMPTRGCWPRWLGERALS